LPYEDTLCDESSQRYSFWMKDKFFADIAPLNEAVIVQARKDETAVLFCSAAELDVSALPVSFKRR